MREREMTGFQGIFLDEISKKRLIDLQERKLKYIVKDMHITFKFGKTEMYPEEVLNKDLKVMDSTATALCRDNNMPLLVFGISNPENIVKAVKGEKIGTIVK